jgi:hypothetical protein
MADLIEESSPKPESDLNFQVDGAPGGQPRRVDPTTPRASRRGAATTPRASTRHCSTTKSRRGEYEEHCSRTFCWVQLFRGVRSLNISARNRTAHEIGYG